MESPVLLYTKFLVPRTNRDHLSRPRLIRQLNDNLDKRLILVAAPAGYGKTALLAEFARKAALPVAWYQLDPTDADPFVLLTHLVKSIRQVHRSVWVGASALALLQSEEDRNRNSGRRITSVLINDLTEYVNDDLIIILDDYHLITNDEVHLLIDYMIDNAPPHIHLAISTRTTPALSLARLRARGMLAELHIDDLRFRQDEVAHLVADRGTPLSEESIASLSERSEGWAAGIQMMLSSLTGKEEAQANRFVSDLQGTHRYIFDYLADEVLQGLSPELRSFMLSTSILAQMNASICDALLDRSDSQEMLTAIERGNIFLIPLDDMGEWYRYHYLFREFLLARLRSQKKGEVLELEQRAGAYYQAHDEPQLAYTHYLNAGDQHAACHVLEGIAPDFLERGQVEVLHRFINQLPDEILNRHPHLYIHHGDALRQLGQSTQAKSQYDKAAFVFRVQEESTGLAHALTRMSKLARSQGDYVTARSLAQQAVEVVPDDEHSLKAQALMALARSEGFLEGMDRGRALGEQALAEAEKAGHALRPRERASLLRSLGHICWWYGDPQATVQYCRDALRFVPDENSPAAARIYMTLSTPYLYWRDLETAQHYAERGLHIVQELQLTELLPQAYMALGNVLARTGEVTRAENSLKQALDWADRMGGETSYERVMAIGTLAYDLCLQNRYDEAQQLSQSVLWSHVGSSDTYEMVVCRSILADVALELGQLDYAWTVFADLEDSAAKRNFQLPLAMIYFGLAYICLATDQAEAGLEMANKSLALIEDTKAIQLYLDQGERARLVCEAVIQSGYKSEFVLQVMERLPASESSLEVTGNGSPVVRIFSLGSFRVEVNDRELTQEDWQSSKARDLLAYFATFRHERMPIDRVLDAIWPDGDGRSRTAFHTALYRMRSALRREDQSTKFVLAEASEYMLDKSRFWLDVDEFDLLLSKASGTDMAGSIPYLQKAVDLYTDEYLKNLYYDWLMPERRRLQDRLINALRTLSTYYATQEQYSRALELAQRALGVDPIMEEFHCLVLRYYAAMNDRSGMVRHYREMEALLQDELGAAPLDSTKALFERLSKNE